MIICTNDDQWFDHVNIINSYKYSDTLTFLHNGNNKKTFTIKFHDYVTKLQNIKLSCIELEVILCTYIYVF